MTDFKPNVGALWCVRTKCQLARGCRYTYNCKAVTPLEAQILSEERETERLRREKDAAQELRNRKRVRDDLEGRIESMLETFGISLFDFGEWMKDNIEK